MREIKFRVWDCELKNFVREDDLMEYDDFDVRYFNDLFQVKNYSMQQYTGLKDKRGKEIYEGDIIFVDDEKWIVGFDCGAFGLKIDDNDKLTPLFQYKNEELLIIGNIHEIS